MTLNEEVAVEVMGWERDGIDWLKDGKHTDFYTETVFGQEEVWIPDSDLNQARMVAEKGISILMGLCPIEGAMEGCRNSWAKTTLAQTAQSMGIESVAAWDLSAKGIVHIVLMAVREARK